MSLSASLFKKYDIRGIAEGEKAPLTAEAAFLIGQSIGRYFRQQGLRQAVVGRDNRRTSAELQDQLMQGLISSGLNLINLGMISTPTMYWHAETADQPCGGIIVTGSHLTPEYNGFKISIGSENVFGDALQTIYQLNQTQAESVSAGHISEHPDPIGSYLNDLQKRIHLNHRFRVVVDAGNGTAGPFAMPLLKSWDQEQSGIYLEPDGNYPHHLPNPQEAKNVADLGAKVRETQAQVGFAFDGDADRVGVVDENGQPIEADRILALLAQDLLKRHPGATVVGDVLCSQVLFDAIRDAGGNPIMAASGHAVVKDSMRQNQALLGGEMSGHIFLAEDYYGFDDAYLVMGRILQLMDASDLSLSQLNQKLPRLFSTPEYRPHCPDNQKALVIAAVAEQLSQDTSVLEITDVDGVRARFDHGWGLLRASNTEPVLSLRFEGREEKDALRYRDLFIKVLKAFPQVSAIE